MTNDEIFAALEEMLNAPPCPVCNAPAQLCFPRGGGAAIPFIDHIPGCCIAA